MSTAIRPAVRGREARQQRRCEPVRTRSAHEPVGGEPSRARLLDTYVQMINEISSIISSHEQGRRGMHRHAHPRAPLPHYSRTPTPPPPSRACVPCPLLLCRAAQPRPTVGHASNGGPTPTPESVKVEDGAADAAPSATISAVLPMLCSILMSNRFARRRGERATAFADGARSSPSSTGHTRLLAHGAFDVRILHEALRLTVASVLDGPFLAMFTTQRRSG